jgi:hypothetical protein
MQTVPSPTASPRSSAEITRLSLEGESMGAGMLIGGFIGAYAGGTVLAAYPAAINAWAHSLASDLAMFCFIAALVTGAKVGQVLRRRWLGQRASAPMGRGERLLTQVALGGLAVVLALLLIAQIVAGQQAPAPAPTGLVAAWACSLVGVFLWIGTRLAGAVRPDRARSPR